MKKHVFFLLVLLIVMACSKEPTVKENALTNEDISTIVGELPTRIKDSLLLMESKVCISGILTDREKDSLEKIILSDLKMQKKSKSLSVYNGPEYTDSTGKIHLKLFYDYTTQKKHWPSLEVPVLSGWVVVGGGACTFGEGGFGSIVKGYLTESRPNDYLTSWIGSSKDHIISDEHFILVYAIGMKMDNVTPEFLRSKIHVRNRTSIPANHPSDTVLLPAYCLRLGGGARVNWTNYGNLLTTSEPWVNSNSWMVKSKDHRYQSPCTITAYIIGIENISFPDVGYVKVDTTHQEYYVSTGGCWISTHVRPTYALTCPGGHAYYYDFSYGRLLVKMYPQYNNPNEQDGQVYSSDCYYSSPGYTRAYAVGIRAVN